MVREKKAKVAALVLVTVCVFLHMACDAQDYGVYSGCPVTVRVLYHFFHGGWLHLAVNSFVFLQLVFLCDFSLTGIILAWAISSSVPVMWDTPTVGLSGMIYAMFGMATWNARAPMAFVMCIGVYMAIGLSNPSSNVCLHLFSYIAGLIVGILLKRVD